MAAQSRYAIRRLVHVEETETIMKSKLKKFMTIYLYQSAIDTLVNMDVVNASVAVRGYIPYFNLWQKLSSIER